MQGEEKAEALKAEGNELVKNGEFGAAVVKYTSALAGGVCVGIEMPVKLNRCQCYLNLARDDSTSSQRRLELFGLAEKDAKDAQPAVLTVKLELFVKANFRLAQAIVGRSLILAPVLLHLSGGQMEGDAEQKADIANSLASELHAAQNHLSVALQAANPAAKKQITKVSKQAAKLQAEMRGHGATAWEVPPKPRPEAFAVGVRFVQGGAGWVENTAQLELPFPASSQVQGDNVAVSMPCELRKAANVNNGGELAVAVVQSAHLGEDVLRESILALHQDPEFDMEAGRQVAWLSDPSTKPSELHQPDEFVLSLGFQRTFGPAIDTLVLAGLIDKVRELEATEFGEQRNIYRVRF
jgi:hypothetical protein